jgi:organic hydroperoxide reductase OsmC/OhrA
MATHDYQARVHWERGDALFTDNRYSRGHTWHFDGGVEVPASSSPHVVRVPLSLERAVDPEEAFVASLSSCHMLFFLHFAASSGLRVDEYTDDASGTLSQNAAGKMVMTSVVLRPRASFSGERLPTRADLQHLHHRAHEDCFIANSVTTAVRVEPVFDV